MENNNQTLDLFLRKLITAPRDRQAAAVESALSLLNGQPNNHKFLYNGSEAAKLLSISTVTLWRMVQSRTIVPVLIRSAKRYRRADLLALAAGKGAQ